MGFNFGPQILFIALRMIFSGIFLLGYYFSTHKNHEPFTKHDWKLFFHASITGIGVAYVAEYWALKYIPVATVSVIFLSVPFFSVLFEHFHGLGKLTIRKTIGLMIGLCGIVPILLQKSDTSIAFSLDKYELAMFLAASLYAYGWIAVKKMVQNKHHSTLYINGMRMLVGGIFALISSPFFEAWDGLKPAVSSWPQFSWYIFLISFVALICYSFYGFLIQYYSAALVAFCGFTEPFFAALYGWILLGEKVSWIFFASLGIIFAGLYLFYQEEVRLKE